MALEAEHPGIVDHAQTAPPSTRWRDATFEAFQVPGYRIVWFGTILAFVAYMMMNTASSVVAYDLTGNNRAVGLVAFGAGLTQSALNPIAGAVADRFSKRLLILSTHIVILVIVTTVALLLKFNALTIGLLAAFAFIQGGVFSFIGPTRTALLGEFVSERQLGNAMALVQVGNNFARVAGPFLATGMIAIAFIGASGAYFFIAGLFVLILATYYRIPATPAARRRRRTSVLQDVRLGFAYVRKNPRLLHALVSFHLVAIFGLSHYVLMPGFAKETLGAGTTGLGLLLGVNALGGLAMSLAVASLADSKRAPWLLSVSSLAFGLSLVTLGLMPNLVTALVAIVFVGSASSAFQTLNNALAVRISDPGYHGRVIGLMFLAWGVMSLVCLPIGYIADLLGERAVISGLGALLCGVTGLLFVWRLRIERA